MSETINRILSKLAEARRQGKKCFGSEGHHFKLRPPLPESAVRAFEQQHGILLPEDYRQFLIEAGDGGAGPYYGSTLR